MSDRPEPSDNQIKAKKSAVKLFMLVLVMFAFGFAMVPLYSLVCSVTGLSSTSLAPGRVKESSLNLAVDKTRTITVGFDTTINTDLPWDVYPKVKTIDVHPGEIAEVMFVAKNNSNRRIEAQAVPGITPWQATEYFEKIECFCFTSQTLEAGESRDMLLKFVVDGGLPEQYKTITLSYTLMDKDRSKLRLIPDPDYMKTHEH
ncbi:MAG: cytochrome c oxidase assembly protein [Gammaproteobacteria bacterium]|nr:cytochrome c oxidase assembly protein [Gammaproteobacteria bacterium]